MSDKKAYDEWLLLCKRIKSKTAADRPTRETSKQKRARIEKLLCNFNDFCKYYFKEYCKSDFAWFHLEAEKKITADKKVFAVLEWPREHAKSVFADILLPMWLKAKEQLTGLILVSANQDKAAGLLSDLQAQLEYNELYAHDFGEQVGYGSWTENHFVTKDGVGFWAFGRGQSPRGARQAALRPNMAIVDDIDDKGLVKNQTRVLETVDWIKEDLLGSLSIEGGRLLLVGNRIHKQSTLAHIVGDIEQGDKKNEGITHIKVFAFERGKDHRKAMPGEKGAKPAWHERHKASDLIDRMSKQGHRAAMREYFHEHHEEGLIFKEDWIIWQNMPKKFDSLAVYCDPSFKDTAKADYKAIVTVGRIKEKYYVVDAWVRQASVKSMVNAFYDIFSTYGNEAKYYMEANMLQDLLLKEFDQEAAERGYHVPLRADKKKKDNKFMRIEAISPLFERGHVIFNEAKRGCPDMQNLKLQIIGFGNLSMKDDGPDALEGAISKLSKSSHSSKRTMRTGQHIKQKR